MGCLCSKKATQQNVGVEARKATQPSNKSGGLQVDQEVYNILSDEQRFLVDVQNLEQVVTGKSLEKRQSLMKYPPQDELLARFWINKRGHVVRTWKRRFCVLEKTELKYYSDEMKAPPYCNGKTAKGSLAFLGAVCVVKHDDPKVINVEIYGNYGEKDLFFYVENTEPGQNFVRMLEWAIRKSTITTLVRNIKAKASGKAEKRRKKGGNEKQACLDWLGQQDLLFNAAVEKLKQTQLVHLINFTDTGVLFLQPALLRLWCILGDDHINASTHPGQIGLAYQPLPRNEYNMMKDNALLTEDVARIICFEDIEDYTFQPLDSTATSVLKQKVSDFHHSSCNAQNYLVLTLTSTHGHALHILACCLHDYQEYLLALQNILLFLLKEQKCKDAAASKDISELTSKAAAVTAMKLIAA